MKLTKRAQLMLGIGIFAIAFVSLYMIYLDHEREQEELDRNIAAAQAPLPELISEKESLENQLTELEADLAEATSLLSRAKARFPESAESIEYDEVLFRIAEACDLEIIRLTASEPRDKEVEDVTYSVTTFRVDVEGEVAGMLEFVNAIATGGEFTTATVEVVDISIPVLEPLTEEVEEEAEEEEEEAEEEEEEVELPSATIRFVVYSYKGE